ncbi:MAG: hypothetical protein HWQ38_01715 [Nostoc sp. NMS7]|uniref:hypothetical protein n=1 Tax=Nostoc sp. NMS7 TaxID=2815391 RepID=UPI0025E22AE9|nr:hypothetical protein [Nostoc sp. NMS7]MBN3945262.1 hypothetical protein [Nostoc sp. NMS7]
MQLKCSLAYPVHPRYLHAQGHRKTSAKAASLAMLSPVARSGVELETNQKLEIDANSHR